MLKRFRISPLFIIFLFSCTQTLAQTQSMLYRPAQNCPLNATQQLMVDKALNIDYFTQYFFVKVNNLIANQVNGYTMVHLPDLWPDPFYLKSSYVEYTDENEYVYAAVLRNDGDDEAPLYYARLLLISDQGKKFGQLKINNLVYSIYDLGNDCHMIVEIASLDGQTEICDMMENEEVPPNEVPENSNPCGSCIADVYFLYTPAANNLDPDINQTARTAVEITNYSISNSRITGSGSQLRLRISGSQVFTGFVESTQSPDPDYTPEQYDLIRLSQHNIAFNGTTVNTIRNQTQSDVVAMLTSHAGGAGGQAQMGYPEFQKGFLWSGFIPATRTHTFAHEVGHLIGGTHQPNLLPIYPPAAPYAWAFEKKKPNSSKELQTNVCGWAGDNTIKLDNYSTPRVTSYALYRKKGTVIGSSTQNNARLIGESGCLLANLFPNIQQVSAWISGPSVVCPNQWANFDLNLNCPEEVASITWEYSFGGFQWYPFSTTSGQGGMSLNAVMPQFIIDDFIYVRATVNVGGSSYSTSIKVDIDIYNTPCSVIPKAKNLVDSNADNHPSFSIYPNPGVNEARLVIIVDEFNQFTQKDLLVVDPFGREIHREKLYLNDSGETQFTLDMSGWSKGVYFVLIDNQKMMLQKI